MSKAMATTHTRSVGYESTRVRRVPAASGQQAAEQHYRQEFQDLKSKWLDEVAAERKNADALAARLKADGYNAFIYFDNSK